MKINNFKHLVLFRGQKKERRNNKEREREREMLATVRSGREWGEHVYILLVILIVGGLIGSWSIYLAIEAGRFQTRVSDLSKRIKRLNNELNEIYQVLLEKGQIDGYAPLGNDSIVPAIFLPPGVANLQPNSGCWDAATNNPPLSDGIGAPNELFIVCVPGSFTLDGQSTWNLYDQVIFNTDLSQWIRIDSGRNTITDAGGPPSGSEQSIIVDGLGPMFTVKKADASGDATLTLVDNDTTLEFDISPLAQPNTTLSDQPGGTGESFISQGSGFNLELKSFFGEGNVTASAVGDNVVFNGTGGVLGVSSGWTTMNVFFSGYFPVNTFVRMGWHKIGKIIRLSSISPIFTNLVSPTRAGTITFFIGTASDPTILASSIVGGRDQAGGLVTGYPLDNSPPATPSNSASGWCLASAPNIVCKFGLSEEALGEPEQLLNFELQYIDSS